MPRREPANRPAREPEHRPDVHIVEKTPLCEHWDWPLFVLTVLLLSIGLVTLFSASYAFSYDENNGNPYYYIIRQLAFAGIGIGIIIFASRLDYHLLKNKKIVGLILAGTFLMLLSIKIPGLKSMWVTRNGATRWINVFGLFTVQPSEVAKTAVIISFSAIASQLNRKQFKTFRKGVLPFAAIIGGIAFCMYLEKHLSGMVIIGLIGGCILYFGGLAMRWIFAGVVGGVSLVTLYIQGKEYAGGRLASWLDPWESATGLGYQAVQSHIAIGSGGFWGLGLGQSVQKHLYLPEPPNDFIFSVYCEEMGFVGAVIVIALFCLIIWRGFYIARHANDKFGMLLASGITVKIALQAFLNFAVVTGVAPITGASLPFFSYGGTATIMQLIEICILLSISRSMPAKYEG